MPHQLFLFLDDTFDLEQAESIAIDNGGEALCPLACRQPQELYELSQQHPLTVVLPCSIMTAHLVSLPTLKKAENMVANILEENLLTDIDEMHFVFNKSIKVQDQYLVYAISISYMKQLIETLQPHQLYPTTVTSDLVYTLPNHLLIGPDYAQNIDPNNPGAISVQLMTTLTDSNTFTNFEVESFSDSSSTTAVKSLPISQQYNQSYNEFIAKQLAMQNNLNALHGKFKAIPKKNILRKAAITLAIFSCIFCIGANAYQYFTLQKEAIVFKKKNFERYKQFFPNASDLISPRFRVEQLIMQNKKNQEAPFFQLATSVAPLMHNAPALVVSNINVQGEQVTLTFSIDSFSSLESLQKAFNANAINVYQLSATTKDNRVNVIWRISL